MSLHLRYPVFDIYALSPILNTLINIANSLSLSLYIYIYIYIYMKVSWLIVVESDRRATFSIATTWKWMGWRNSFPWIVPLPLDSYLIMLSVKQGGIKCYFWVFGMTLPGFEPQSFRQLANTLTIMSMGRYTYIYIHIVACITKKYGCHCSPFKDYFGQNYVDL